MRAPRADDGRVALPQRGRLSSLPQGSTRDAEAESAKIERRPRTAVFQFLSWHQRVFFRPWKRPVETSREFQLQALEEWSAEEPAALKDAPPSQPYEVSEFLNCIIPLKQYLKARHESFTARQIKTRFSNWAKLTSDPDIFQTVKGLKMKFDCCPNAMGRGH